MNFVEDKMSNERLGDYIARIRNERGMSHQDLSAVTKITVAYLKAIEAGDWKAFPVAAYARGYLNSVSAKLNLDPKKVLAWYAEETGAQTADEFQDVSSHERIAPVAEGEIKKGGSKAVIIVIALIGLAFLVASHFLDVTNFDFMKSEPPAENQVVAVDSIEQPEIPEGAEKVAVDSVPVAEPAKKDTSVKSVSQAVVDEAVKKSDLPASATIFISSDSKKDSVAEPTNKTNIELIGSGETTSWVGMKRRENSDRFVKEANISKAGMKMAYNTEDTLFVTIGEPRAISKMILNGVETALPEVRFGRVVKFRVFGGQIVK